jgi:hypothetical protein
MGPEDSHADPGKVNTSDTQSDGENISRTQAKVSGATAKTAQDQALTQAELQVIEQLKQTDAKVRRHEMAHIAAGGRYITSGANFTYKRGPDGKNYAVGGEVHIDTSEVPGDPEATLKKMKQVRNAALAPADPSAQDLKVASQASAQAAKALADLMISRTKHQAQADKKQALGNIEKAAQAYTKTDGLPESSTSSFGVTA